MKYDGTLYYYILSLQGDVIGIIDENEQIQAEYSYDAWGKVLSESGTLAGVNPIRYRGYYYDSETGLYYLQSRYYDPTVRRYINADDFDLLLNQDSISGLNIYAYCDDDPIMRSDDDGEAWRTSIVQGSAYHPLTFLVMGVIIVVSSIRYAKKKTKGKSKSEVDPYARAGQKKQGRENKNKSRQKDGFEFRNNRRDKKPARVPKHSPSNKGHRKY